jgi:cell division protein FtsL
MENTNTESAIERPEELRLRRRTYSWSAYGFNRMSRDSAASTERPALRLWREILKRQSVLILTCCAVLFLFGFIALSRMSAAAGTTQSIDKYRKELLELNKGNELIESDIALLSNATRIFEKATEAQMVDPAYVIEISR